MNCNENSKEKLDYSERMIQISDDVASNIIGGRTEHKRQWIKNGRKELWEICESIAEFKHRARLSEAKANELDRHFYRIYGGRLLGSIPQSRRTSKSQIAKLKELFG